MLLSQMRAKKFHKSHIQCTNKYSATVVGVRVAAALHAAALTVELRGSVVVLYLVMRRYNVVYLLRSSRSLR
jgi:hypothetical protein